jgi:predicted AAA+ superfamily ATPase
MKETGINYGLILTMDEKRQEESTGFFLEIIPVWEWLLTNDFKNLSLNPNISWR